MTEWLRGFSFKKNNKENRCFDCSIFTSGLGVFQSTAVRGGKKPICGWPALLSGASLHRQIQSLLHNTRFTMDDGIVHQSHFQWKPALRFFFQLQFQSYVFSLKQNTGYMKEINVYSLACFPLMQELLLDWSYKKNKPNLFSEKFVVFPIESHIYCRYFNHPLNIIRNL